MCKDNCEGKIEQKKEFTQREVFAEIAIGLKEQGWFLKTLHRKGRGWTFHIIPLVEIKDDLMPSYADEPVEKDKQEFTRMPT